MAETRVIPVRLETDGELVIGTTMGTSSQVDLGNVHWYVA